MVIDFNKMAEEAKPNFKGGLKEYNVKMFTDDTNKIMHGRLVPGASIGFHTHETDQEVIYVLEGEGTVINGEGIPDDKALPGQALYCAKGQSHSLVNTGTKDLIFFAVVSAV